MTNPSTNVEYQPASVGEDVEVREVSRSGIAPAARWLNKLRLFWTDRRLLARSAAVGLCLSTILAFTIRKEYQSTVRLMPPETQSAPGMAMLAALTAKGGYNLGGAAGDLLGLKTSGALVVGILQSRSIQERLVERFELRKVYGLEITGDAERRLGENSSVIEDRKSGILTIRVTDQSPQRAAQLGGAYVEELDHLVSQLSTSAAHRERVFLEERLRTVKSDLDTAAQQFGQFASKNSAIDIQAQGKAMMEAAARLQGELIAAESELQMLKQIYTENNVRVRGIQARIGELQRQLNKMGGQRDGKPESTTQASDPISPSMRELPLLAVTYADLLRRTKIQETVFEILTQQFEFAKVQEAKETPSVKVLDRAEVPARKSYPSRLLVMFLGTSLFLGAACLWVLGRARWHSTDRNDPRRVFAMEVFTSLKTQWPVISSNGAGWRGLPKTLWNRARTKRDFSGEKT
jgi:capsule polysaccharide export protein KpsE/RkpR